MRVLSQSGLLLSLGLSKGGHQTKNSGAEIPRFATQKWIKPFIDNDLIAVLKSPIIFQPLIGGNAFGYPATILPQICEAIMDAADAGKAGVRQASAVEKSKILLRGLARTGIIALVDEATGYQEMRDRLALSKILEKYLAQEWREWTKTFPHEFYAQIFRLKGWGVPDGVKRPSVIGHYTNDIVYARLAPEVLRELKKRNPVIKSKGRRERTHHQWFNPDFGHPKLKEHIEGVIALMRASTTWDGFKRLLERAYTKYGTTRPLPFEDD